MSSELMNLVSACDGEILGYAAAADTTDSIQKHEYMQKLERIREPLLDPVKDIISVCFYMKDGNTFCLKAHPNAPIEEIRRESWYRKALANPDQMILGYYDADASEKLFSGNIDHQSIFSFSFAPDVTVDRSGKIEVVTLYSVSDAAARIRKNNQEYAAGKNKLGFSRIVDSEGNTVFSSGKDIEREEKKGYTCISSTVTVLDETWYIENHIKTRELTEDFWRISVCILTIAAGGILFILYLFASSLKRITEPFQPEEQCLPSPDCEKNILPKSEKAPEDYLKDILEGRMTPEKAAEECSEFFGGPYLLIGVAADYSGARGSITEIADRIVDAFGSHALFASRCCMTAVSSGSFVIYWRVVDELYLSRTSQILNEKYFTNKFTKEAGETFSDYLTGLRMQKAKELLRTTGFKVYEVAEMSGYKNVSHFNRMFKKVTGISPVQYRKS
ncbi:MAG: helix-turn-helix domain-containing protein [Lachnospiraceae bacterium]